MKVTTKIIGKPEFLTTIELNHDALGVLLLALKAYSKQPLTEEFGLIAEVMFQHIKPDSTQWPDEDEFVEELLSKFKKLRSKRTSPRDAAEDILRGTRKT